MADCDRKYNVVVTETLSDRPATWLRDRANVVFCRYDDPAGLDGHLPGADALVVRTYTQVNDSLLSRCSSRLKVVARAGVGLDNIDLDACRRRGIRVLNTPDANTQAVAEYTLGLILDDCRPRTPLVMPCDAETFHRLRQTELGRQLDRLTLGIVGFGRIGRRLAEFAHAIGMNMRVCDLLPEAALRKQVDFPFEYIDHAAIYGTCDVISLHVDGRASNRHMINRTMLEHFKPDCLLINTSRGMVIDHAALRDWAKSHPAARIMLDVHDPEPPPENYPVAGLTNITLLPHIAARTDTALENMSWVVRDVMAVLENSQK